jgi:hypothetical protein
MDRLLPRAHHPKELRMETPFVHRVPADVAHGTRARVVSLIGPVTVACGLIWGILQPARVTILHPRGQGFWWLALEPPVLVVVVGVVFALIVAKPLVADLEAHDAAR